MSSIVLVAIAACAGCDRNLVIPSSEVSGLAVASGPLVGAVIHAYRLDDTCTKTEEIAASAPTSADGRFTIPLGFHSGTIYLEATGPASYEELATGEIVPVDPGVVVAGVAFKIEPDEKRAGVVLSGLSTMATRLGAPGKPRARTAGSGRRWRAPTPSSAPTSSRSTSARRCRPPSLGRPSSRPRFVTPW